MISCAVSNATSNSSSRPDFTSSMANSSITKVFPEIMLLLFSSVLTLRAFAFMRQRVGVFFPVLAVKVGDVNRLRLRIETMRVNINAIGV